MGKLRELYYQVWPGTDGLKTYEYLIAKEKIHIGKIEGHNAYVTFVYNHKNSFYNEDYIVLKVIYNHQEIETESGYKYDKWDFTYINENDIESGVHEIYDYIDGKSINHRNTKLEFVDNYKDLVYDEMYKPECIKISKSYKKLSDAIRRMRAGHNFGLKYQILHLQREILSKKYIDCVRYNKDEEKLKSLENMTEEEYNTKSKEEEEKWNDIFNDVDFNDIKENKIEKYSDFIKNKKK